MLDKRMVYTCGYWKEAKNLDEAQEAKLDLVCRKLNLKEGETVLDIGCGWGSFAKYAAEKYGVSVVGITVSKEQASLVTRFLFERFGNAGYTYLINHLSKGNVVEKARRQYSPSLLKKVLYPSKLEVQEQAY